MFYGSKDLFTRQLRLFWGANNKSLIIPLFFAKKREFPYSHNVERESAITQVL